MDVDSFDYELPPERIAQAPAEIREESRLLRIDRSTGRLGDHVFRELPDLLVPGDLVVVNDSRVIPARVFAREARSGADVELLFVEPDRDGRWRALTRPGRRVRPGSTLVVGPEYLDVVAAEPDGTRVIARRHGTIEDLLARVGSLPLPPYIGHHAKPGTDDHDRYQTVYARVDGSVAAPTAGLHLSAPVLERLAVRGIEVSSLTLHVGPATFRPIRTASVEAHRLPAERVTIPAATAEAVNAARAAGRRVVAVGTTTTRALEGVAGADGSLAPFDGRVALYIRPGYGFRVVDALVTNFHLPRSSLLVLVAAFAGQDAIFRAYRHAIAAGYRFYSYGDATLIE